MSDYDTHWEDVNAEANMEAQPPTLLEALKELFDLLEDNRDDAPWYLRKHYNTATEAIRKAKGEVMMHTKEQYGWIRINGEYFIYDRKHGNIPLGMSQPYKTKAKVLEAICKASR